MMERGKFNVWCRLESPIKTDWTMVSLDNVTYIKDLKNQIKACFRNALADYTADTLILQAILPPKSRIQLYQDMAPVELEGSYHIATALRLLEKKALNEDMEVIGALTKDMDIDEELNSFRKSFGSKIYLFVDVPCPQRTHSNISYGASVSRFTTPAGNCESPSLHPSAVDELVASFNRL